MKSTLKIALVAISFVFLTACGSTTETTTTETPAETTETTTPAAETPAAQDSTTTGDSAKVNQ